MPGGHGRLVVAPRSDGHAVVAAFATGALTAEVSMVFPKSRRFMDVFLERQYITVLDLVGEQAQRHHRKCANRGRGGDGEYPSPYDVGGQAPTYCFQALNGSDTNNGAGNDVRGGNRCSGVSGKEDG